MQGLTKEKPLDYNVLMTGSSGNCTIIGDVMFDLGGINWKHLPELLKSKGASLDDINYITHSHHHGDHYQPVLNWQIYKNYPHIKFMVRPHMFERLWNDMNITKRKKHLDTPENMAKRFIPMPDYWESEKIAVSPFDLPHGDILSTGYAGVEKSSGTTFFFGTDFESIRDLPKLQNIDHIFIEANHEADFQLKLYEKGVILNDWAVESSSRHLSIEDAMTYSSLVGSEGKTIHFLHRSSRFFNVETLDVDELVRAKHGFYFNGE